MSDHLTALGNALFRIILNVFRSGRPSKRRRVCIFKPDGIGDFVLSSEAIRRAVDFYGANNVSLMIATQLVDLVKTLFSGVEVLPIVPGHAGWKEKLAGLRGLCLAIRANAYDEVICLRHYRTRYEDTILSALHAGKVTLLRNQAILGSEVDAQTSSWLTHFQFIQTAHNLHFDERCEVPREWSFHASVLSEALGETIRAESLKPNWDARAKPGAPVDPFLLIAPLAGRQIRDIPPRLVAAAVRTATSSGLQRVVLTGSKAQSAQLEYYLRTLRHAIPHSHIEIAHPPDLPAFVDLVAKAGIVVTAESSAAHIATALDKTALILIGGGHYGWFAPWRRSDKQIWLSNKLPCFDCNWRCPYVEPLCITHLSTAQVEAALNSLGN